MGGEGGLEYKCRFTHSIIQMIYLIDKPCCKPKLKLYTLGIYICICLGTCIYGLYILITLRSRWRKYQKYAEILLQLCDLVGFIVMFTLIMRILGCIF